MLERQVDRRGASALCITSGGEPTVGRRWRRAGWPQQRVPRQTDEVAPLMLYYVAGRTAAEDVERTGNVLTVENIQRAAALEDELAGLDAREEVCLRERGQQTGCAPLRSAVPYLRSATDDASLRAAIDAMYETLDGSAGAPLGGLKASWFFEQVRVRVRRASRRGDGPGAELGARRWHLPRHRDQHHHRRRGHRPRAPWRGDQAGVQGHLHLRARGRRRQSAPRAHAGCGSATSAGPLVGQ